MISSLGSRDGARGVPLFDRLAVPNDRWYITLLQARRGEATR
jgi:hypothetical protein